MDPRTEAVWTEELLAHAGWVRALARKLVDDRDNADDAVQQTWLAALVRRPSTGRPLRPWLAHVLRTQIALRRRSRLHRREREAVAARPEPLPSTEELVMRTEAHERLVRAVRALREPYRSALVLHYYEGLSAAEIARRRGVPGATVRSQIHRGLELLRTDLDAEFGDRRTWCLALAPLDAARASPPRLTAAPHPLVAKLAATALLAGGLVWLALARPGEHASLAAGAPPARAAAGSLSLPSLASDPAPVEPQRDRAPAQAGDGERVVRVVDEATGEPLPDFEVAVRRPDGATLLARTDAAGRFRLDGIAAEGTWEFALTGDPSLHQRAPLVHGAPLELHVPEERRVLTAEILDVVLAAKVGPTYMLDLGLPPGLRVTHLRAHLRAAGPGHFDTRTWDMHTAAVRPPGDLDAAWVRFAAIQPHLLRTSPPWMLEVSSADGFWSGSAEVSSIAGRHGKTLRVELAPRARLRGNVRDALGPVSKDVLLHLLRADGSPTHRKTDTDEHGGFFLTALEPGAYRVSIETARHAPAEFALALEGGVETVRDFDLVRASIAGAVEGLLTSRSGRYRGSGIVVLASTGIDERLFFAAVKWQERDGRQVCAFSFEEVPGGRYSLQFVACDDQLPWQPGEMEIDAPQADLRLECQDEVETTAFAVHAMDARTGEALARFTIVHEFDGGPEVVLEDVRPVRSVSPDEADFEWRLRFAGMTWAVRSGPAQIPRAPRGRALRWGLFAEGYAPAFGDQTAFIEGDGRRTARVVLERGWGCRLRVVADDPARFPLGGVELWADGRAVAESTADGRLECRLETAPRALELRRAGGEPVPIALSPSPLRLVTEVRLRR